MPFMHTWMRPVVGVCVFCKSAIKYERIHQSSVADVLCIFYRSLRMQIESSASERNGDEEKEKDLRRLSETEKPMNVFSVNFLLCN